MTLVLSLGQLCDLPGLRLLKRPRDSSFITNAPRDFDRWKALRNIQLSLITSRTLKFKRYLTHFSRLQKLEQRGMGRYDRENAFSHLRGDLLTIIFVVKD